MGKLAEKVAVITGAGSGIGRAAALLFAKEGAKVVVADFAPQGGHETVKMIKEAGGQAVFVEVNVSKSADVQKMIKSAVDTYGRLDIMFNNAGIQGKFIMTADLAEDAWNSIIATNLTGAFLGSKYAIQVMLKQGGRRHHQHRLDSRPHRAARHAGLQRLQGRDHPGDQGDGPRVCGQEHQGQLHLSRRHSHAAVPDNGRPRHPEARGLPPLQARQGHAEVWRSRRGGQDGPVSGFRRLVVRHRDRERS